MFCLIRYVPDVLSDVCPEVIVTGDQRRHPATLTELGISLGLKLNVTHYIFE